MRLPVIAGSRRKKRIESLLPGRVRLHANVFAEGRAELTQRRDQFLALRGIARIAQGQHDDLFAVDVYRQKGKRGRFARHHPDIEFVRHRLGEPGELRENDFASANGKRRSAHSARPARPDGAGIRSS